MSFKLTLGRLAFSGCDLRTNEAIAGLTIRDPELVLPEYLYWYLTAFDWEMAAAGDHKVKGKTLNKKKLSLVPVSLPSVNDQCDIIDKLDQAFAEIDRAIEKTERILSQTRMLLVRHLDYVFRGMEAESWPRRSVSEFADHSLGKMLDKQKNRGTYHAYLRNVNVRWFRVDTDDLKEMKVEAREHDRYVVKPGDLLVCEGGYPGRSAIWSGPSEIYYQKAVHRVRPYDRRYTEWLQYYLFYLDATDQLRRYFTGAGIQHFTGKALSRLPVPLPPPDRAAELTKRVAIIRGEIEALQDLRRRKSTALHGLKQSILAETFSFPEEEPA